MTDPASPHGTAHGPAATRARQPGPIYDAENIAHREISWGAGWLSPGGEEDMAELLREHDIAGRAVLDIGVGAGGPAIALLTSFRAGHVTGIDVEQPVLDRAAALAAARGLDTRLALRRVDPGPLPFPSHHFEVVFSKDSFIHIADKARLFKEIRRVLRPGGLCVFSDWCCGPPPYSAEMQAFLENGMGFAMARIEENCAALEQAGFLEITAHDRNRWYADIAMAEAAALDGPRRSQVIMELGAEAAAAVRATARRRATIAAQGHLRPAHFSARAPE